MKMELIQPFINAADAVIADMLKCSTRIGDVADAGFAAERLGQHRGRRIDERLNQFHSHWIESPAATAAVSGAGRISPAMT